MGSWLMVPSCWIGSGNQKAWVLWNRSDLPATRNHQPTTTLPLPSSLTVGFNTPMSKRRIVVGISGSSGPIYGIRLLQVLKKLPAIETHLVLSESSETTLRLEAPEWSLSKVKALADEVHSPGNLAASISSGSFKTEGMVVIPCSMKTLAQIAHSTGPDLLSRAADVTLKERRRLIIVPRETPLHLGHLRNMVSVTEMGAVVLPPVPAFYHQPKTIMDIVDHTVGKALDLLGIEHDLYRRWTGARSEETGARSQKKDPLRFT